MLRVPQKRFRVLALRCRTNQYEAQALMDQLRQMGWTEAQDHESADLCIVNTCTVTEGADKSSRAAIRQLARQHPTSQLVVTGCLAERLPEEVAKIEGVHRIVSNQDKEKLLEQLFPEESIPEFQIRRFEAHTRAFVKVQDGCNSFCTYCIIPYVRGRSRSRPLEEIVREVEGLIAQGYREVVITGINVGDYDGASDPPVRLAQLVRTLDALPGLDRLRVSSIDPDEVDEELEQAILRGEHTCPSMHLVLQSGANTVLKRMNRKYTAQCFLQTYERLKAAQPDFSVTTDVIVGFPGETEEEFKATCDIVRQVRFAKVHVFPYSKRARTRAALYPNQLPHAVIHQRTQELIALAERAAFELREEWVGRATHVLLESQDSHTGIWSGYTPQFLSVEIAGAHLQSNQIIEVKLTDNTPSHLIGREISCC